VFVHPDASVTTTEYVPADKLDAVDPVCPSDQTYVNGGLPVKFVTYIAPVFPAAQFELLTT
jgi:hypothetical protein